jgi:hypothetical protein
MPKLFRITHRGRIGNKMFQYMFAITIAHRNPDILISGVDIDEWGLADDIETIFPNNFEPSRVLHLQGHIINVEEIVRMFDQDKIDCIEFSGWACRAEYYKNRCQLAALFPTPQPWLNCGYFHEYLVVNIRAEDIIDGKHCDYMPTPISFIKAVLLETGLKPIFMGQIGDDWYSQKLKAEFQDSQFISSRGAIGDFELIRQSKNILIPVSTFSWLASFLSESNENIYMPLLGMFNPAQRPDLNFAPKDDTRYHYYQFPVINFRGDPVEIENLEFTKTTYPKTPVQDVT